MADLIDRAFVNASSWLACGDRRLTVSTTYPALHNQRDFMGQNRVGMPSYFFIFVFGTPARTPSYGPFVRRGCVFGLRYRAPHIRFRTSEKMVYLYPVAGVRSSAPKVWA